MNRSYVNEDYVGKYFKMYFDLPTQTGQTDYVDLPMAIQYVKIKGITNPDEDGNIGYYGDTFFFSDKKTNGRYFGQDGKLVIFGLAPMISHHRFEIMRTIELTEEDFLKEIKELFEAATTIEIKTKVELERLSEYGITDYEGRELVNVETKEPLE